MKNKKNVIKLQSPFERIKLYNKSPDVALYKAVIMQMIIDASNVSKDVRASRYEKRAKAWLFLPNEDFRVVCGMAGMNPHFVIKIARSMINSHYRKINSSRKIHVKCTSCCLNETNVKCEVNDSIRHHPF